MKNRRIAVIGAGHIGSAAAAELTLAGHEVNLYEMPQFKESLTPIVACGGIELLGIGKKGFAKISKITTEIEEALKDVQIILIATVAMAHETIARICTPYLEDGQILALLPGNWGSLVFAKVLKEKRPDLRVKIAESISAPYGCRRETPGKAEVTIHAYFKNLAFAAFPAKDTEEAINDLKALYPDFLFPAKNVAEVALGNPNPVLHVGPILMMTGWIESSPKRIVWWDGITPSVLRVIEATGREKNAVLQALGLTDLYPVDRIKEKVIADPECRLLSGPSDMRHRFITEDCPMGMVPWVSLGEMLNIPTPVSKALVTMASEVNGTDYFTEGGNVERLGISGLSINELSNLLDAGYL